MDLAQRALVDPVDRTLLHVHAFDKWQSLHRPAHDGRTSDKAQGRLDPEYRGRAALPSLAALPPSQTLAQSTPDNPECQYVSGNRPGRVAGNRHYGQRASSPGWYDEYGTTHPSLLSPPSLAPQLYYMKAEA